MYTGKTGDDNVTRQITMRMIEKLCASQQKSRLRPCIPDKISEFTGQYKTFIV